MTQEKQPLYFDSRNTLFRSPFGAVPAGTRVTLRMGILDGCIMSYPRLRVDHGEDTQIYPMTALLKKEGDYHLVESSFTPETTGQYWFTFEAETSDGQMLVLGDDPLRLGTEGILTEPQNRTGFLLTAFEPDFEVPEWFRGTVMYQIFPDRFYRSRGKAYPVYPRMHEDWNEEVAVTPLPGQKHYVADDFFGGNLKGIEEKLSYLAYLGVHVIYLNPSFLSCSNHRYNTSDYTMIDPLLGDLEDFTHLCAEAKKREIRIILDGVFSHTGNYSRYFNADGRFPDLGAVQSKDSPYYSWYRFEEWPRKYECWWGDASLPNVEETDPGYRVYMLGENGIVRRWIRAGASGFRLDVADELPDLFLDELYRAVKAENPEAVVIGEVWENAARKFSQNTLRSYVHGRQMHSVMNYPYRRVLLDFLTGACGPEEVRDEIGLILQDYPEPVQYALMNLTGSHDVPRALSLLCGLDENGVPREERGMLEPDEKTRRTGLEKLRLLIAALAFLPGNLCIYYGDETGMTGMSDPFCRRPFPWGHLDEKLVEDVHRIIQIRNGEGALRRGTLRFLDLGEDLLAFVRKWEEEEILVVINRGETTFFKVPEDLHPKEMFGEKPVLETRRIHMDARSWKIFRLNQ